MFSLFLFFKLRCKNAGTDNSSPTRTDWTAVKRAFGRFTVWSLAFAFANGMENVSQAG